MSGGAPQPAAAPADAAVALRAVTHRYGQALALHEVLLELPRGASIALVGPDGVGKSTLLALAAGVKRIQLRDGRASCRKECRSRWSPYH